MSRWPLWRQRHEVRTSRCSGRLTGAADLVVRPFYDCGWRYAGGALGLIRWRRSTLCQAEVVLQPHMQETFCHPLCPVAAHAQAVRCRAPEVVVLPLSEQERGGRESAGASDSPVNRHRSQSPGFIQRHRATMSIAIPFLTPRAAPQGRKDRFTGTSARCAASRRNRRRNRP